ncbi:uncharacterized protein [Nicotiana tomentosiformis]|uniref:uncharacterized protein n=1 Tax=Nicotiana tomentosiformis TaxID=4098 RepID=UPI00388C85A4
MDHPVHHGASASHSSYSAHSGQSSFSALPAQSSHHALSAQASTSNSSGYQEQKFRMDWLSPCNAILDCHAKIVTLMMPGLPKVEWRGSLDVIPRRVISYLKAQHMVEKRCLSYFAFVRDVDVDTPTIASVPVVREFLDVFPADLSGMPPDRDIDFGIDLVQGTQPISIPLYHVAPAELKELKEQLQELLEKGFIRPSVSP